MRVVSGQWSAVSGQWSWALEVEPLNASGGDTGIEARGSMGLRMVRWELLPLVGVRGCWLAAGGNCCDTRGGMAAEAGNAGFRNTTSRLGCAVTAPDDDDDRAAAERVYRSATDGASGEELALPTAPGGWE